MKYMLLMYANEALAQQLTPDETKSLTKAWMAYMKEGQEAGVLLSNGGLAPIANSTTVRVRDGKILTTDGPFAETREQLGGFYMIEAKDLDEATAIAARIPGAKYGSIEVRPIVKFG